MDCETAACPTPSSSDASSSRTDAGPRVRRGRGRSGPFGRANTSRRRTPRQPRTRCPGSRADSAPRRGSAPGPKPAGSSERLLERLPHSNRVVTPIELFATLVGPAGHARRRLGKTQQVVDGGGQRGDFAWSVVPRRIPADFATGGNVGRHGWGTHSKGLSEWQPERFAPRG